MTTTLCLCVVADAHGEVSRANEVAAWVVQHNVAVDAVLCAGDIGNFPLDDAGRREKVAECEAQMSAVLSALENVSARVLYVPGNHCAPTTFAREECPHLTSRSQNIHTRVARIADGLVVAGLGGSTPASQGDEEVFWSAFPFSGGDTELAAELKKIGPLGHTDDEEESDDEEETTREDSAVGAKDTLLMLCHQGPSLSCTATDSVRQPPIHSGSRTLSAFVLARQRRQQLALLIHGHTHNGVGVCSVGSVPVLNPGCLKSGRFAIVTLARPPNRTFWAVSSIELVDLLTP